jgi:hypothetical protein
VAWRRPEAPRSPEEREAAHRRGLELQADLYGVPAEGIASTGRNGRDNQDDELGESTLGVLGLITLHPVIAVIVLPIVPVPALVWLLRRLSRPAS